MGRPRGAIWQEFVETENDIETGKERVKCKHCDRVVSKRAHRLHQHLIGCKPYARAIDVKLSTDEALHSITRGSTLNIVNDNVSGVMPLEPPLNLHIGSTMYGSEGSAGRRHLEPTSAGRQLEAQQVYGAIMEYYGTRMQQTSNKLSDEVILTGRGVIGRVSPWIAQELAKIPQEVMQGYLGCGNPVPLGIEGMRILDIGSGSGRDAYLAAALVGSRGYVLGLDLTPQQVEIAERHIEEFTITLGLRTPNLRFIQGHMESLEQSGIANRSIDLVISNSALNLSPHKEQALKEIFRVLRPGGEFQLSDIFVSRRLPESVRKHELLYSECIGGALYIEDFKRLCRQLGFGEPREVSRTLVEIKRSSLSELVGLAEFYSITFRCFKVPHIESGVIEEDYGHVGTYLGTIPGQPHGYALDRGLYLESLRPVRIGGNTASILKHSWLKKYFNVQGDWNVHFGPFETTNTIPQTHRVVGIQEGESMNNEEVLFPSNNITDSQDSALNAATTSGREEWM